MSSLYEVGPDGRATFRFHPGQLRAWDSRARFVFALAGTQGGKTSFGPWWLWREIRDTALPEGGANDYLAVTASYDLFKLKMLPEIREAFEQRLRWGRYWSSDRVLELADPATGLFWARSADDRMWGRVVLRSAAAKGGLESLTGRAAWLDECGQDEFSLEAWEAVLRRLALAQGRVLGTTTPYNLGWMKFEVYDRWVGGDPDYEVIQFESRLNPSFPAAEYERAKSTMPPWRFAMFYKGQFGRPAGLIYDCFDADTQAIEPFDIPREWPRYVGVDFGAVNTALVWLAQDMARGRWIVYRESLEGGLTTRQHVEQARQVSEYENLVTAFGGAKSESQQRMDWGEAGLYVAEPGVSDVESGISRVYGLMKPKRLCVFKTCTGLLDEVGTYRRKLDQSGQPTEVIEDKRLFHRLDALRYVVSGVTGGHGPLTAEMIRVGE